MLCAQDWVSLASDVIHATYRSLVDAVNSVEERIKVLDKQIAANSKFDDTCKRLSSIPGIGPVTSTTIVALVGDASRFPTGRDFAAWIGLVPRQNSSGSKLRLGRITKEIERCEPCSCLEPSQLLNEQGSTQPKRHLG
jgi:transposase